MKNKKKKNIKNKKYFNNILITKKDLQKGYISYLTLSKTFNYILCNDILNLINDEIEPDFWENVVNGSLYKEVYFEHYNFNDFEVKEFVQYFIIDEKGFNILEKFTDEVVVYSKFLNIYIWCCQYYLKDFVKFPTTIKIKDI